MLTEKSQLLHLASAPPRSTLRTQRPSRRVALYSHDTVGLGHTRRNLALAAALVLAGEATDVLLVTGNPEAGALPLPDHTDIVTLPTITKDATGRYQSRVFHSPLSVVVDIRSKVIEAALTAFEPDLLIVDKVPLGVEDELEPTLARLVRSGRTRIVLGLREILDEPVSAVRDWESMGTTQAIADFYDEVWVYGDRNVYDPVVEYGLPATVAAKIVYTGYLSHGRSDGVDRPSNGACRVPDSPYVLCLVGGGQDGFALAEAFAGTSMPPGHQGIVVTGPFMTAAQRRQVRDAAAANLDISVHGFVPNAEELLRGAAAVVSMAGYNSACEILATATPALLVPRTRPRAEQLVRAQRLAEHGLADMVEIEALGTHELGRWLRDAVTDCRHGENRTASAIDLGGLQQVPALVASLVEVWAMQRERAPRVGYVLKMYPRFSETFIVTELLQLQRLGVDLEVFSLRPPADGRFHASLAELRAPVTYLQHLGLRAADVWATLRAATEELVGLSEHLDELIRADLRDAVQAVEIARLVRARGITHLHAHFASVSAVVARLAARLAGITYSVTAHAKDIFHDDVQHDQLRRTLSDAVAVVTVSDFNLEHLRATFGSDAGRVRRVYNGIDLTEFGFRDPGDRPPVIAAVGRLVEKKGFGDLITAAGLLRDAGRSFRVDLVGTGGLQPQLRDQVGRLGLEGCVRMLGGLPQGDVVRIVGEAAAFAAPCVVGADGNRDGLPTVLLEAMALGTPCVGTPVTGIPEVVVDGVTGLLVPESDPVALAAALGRLLDDADLRTSLAKSARELVETEFDTVRQARLVAECFPASLTTDPRQEG